MFEKFTQKSIDVVSSAQDYAIQFQHTKVLSQHLLMGLVFHTKGVQAKILNFDKINFGELSVQILASCEINPKIKDGKDILFSKEVRTILKNAVNLSNELNSNFVMPQHIALAILSDKNCGAYKILKNFDIDEEKIIPNLKRILEKSSVIENYNPEVVTENTQLENINDFFREPTISEILTNAHSKVTTQGYEIVGSEQILLSVLDNKNYKISEILEKYSVTADVFLEKLSKFSDRNAEFENSEKQIIFTPNAFRALMLAVDFAKESGSVSIQPEHVVMGILKSKRGIAYKILSSLIPPMIDFEDVILKKIDDTIPETLAILRLAKEEARNLGSYCIGTEMILLGILSYGIGVAASTLRHLGITLKDARVEVKKLIKTNDNIENLTLIYSPRAKKMLEVAYKTAAEHKRPKVKSENLLYGITKMPNCLAMQVLTNLGTDILEIQQGIKQELLGGMEL